MADTLQKPDIELNMWPMTFSGESSHGKSSHDSDLEIIEVQMGKILKESDIIRLDDPYKRTKK